MRRLPIIFLVIGTMFLILASGRDGAILAEVQAQQTVTLELNAPADGSSAYIRGAEFFKDGAKVGEFTRLLVVIGSGARASASVVVTDLPDEAIVTFRVPYYGNLTFYSIQPADFSFSERYFLPNPSPGGTVGPQPGDPQFNPFFLISAEREVDFFPYSSMTVEITSGGLSEIVTLVGPTRIEADLVNLADIGGFEQVPTEIVQMELTGNSGSFGPVTLRLRNSDEHPFQRSVGSIRETTNSIPGVLEIPPFISTGTADSFFDLFFEIEFSGQIYHNENPKRISAVITRKPAAAGETYENLQITPLLNESNVDAGVEIGEVFYTPIPITPITLLCNGLVPTLIGTDGDDFLSGTSGPDVIHGLGGDDYISGYSGDDVICGGSGNDYLSGGTGKDYLIGGEGNDRLYGGTDDDSVVGGAGRDSLKGQSGSDSLEGGAGNDRLYGGTSNDSLNGGDGTDYCNGGTGSDTALNCEMHRSVP